jgi:sugar phosphate permease
LALLEGVPLVGPRLRGLPELLLGAQAVLRLLAHAVRIPAAPERSDEPFEHGVRIGSPAVSRYRWTILALGTGAQAAYSAVFLGIPVLAPALRAEYGLTLPEVGLAIATANLGSVVTLLPWGLLADRAGERVVLAGGLTGAAAALTGAAFAPSFGLLVAALTVAGAAGASVNAASGRAVMGWFGSGERGFALGIRQTAVPIGGFVVALVLPPIVDAWGVRGGLVALAAACFATALAGLGGLREAPVSHEELRDVAHPLRDSRIWRLSVGSAFIIAAQASILGFVVLFLHGERGLSTAEAGGVFALMQVLGGALRVGAGSWSDRVRARIAPLRQLAFGLAATLLATAVLIEAPLALLLPALVAAGALSLSWNGLSFTAAAELAGRARSGAAIGFQQTALSVSYAATAPVFAAVVDAASWRLGFALAALMPLAGATMLRRLAL